MQLVQTYQLKCYLLSDKTSVRLHLKSTYDQWSKRLILGVRTHRTAH